MIIDPLSPIKNDLPVQITKESGDPEYVVTEIVTFAGVNLQADGDNADEKEAARKAFKDDVQKRVARHLAGKRADLPVEPSTLVSNILDSWTKEVQNVDYFVDNKGGDEE